MKYDFTSFSNAIHKRFNDMQKRELFIVDVEDIYTAYLLAFPPGTDPIYRERSYHDCNCCKNFLRRIGVLDGDA